jgi:hypothetical protein
MAVPLFSSPSCSACSPPCSPTNSFQSQKQSPKPRQQMISVCRIRRRRVELTLIINTRNDRGPQGRLQEGMVGD